MGEGEVAAEEGAATALATFDLINAGQAYWDRYDHYSRVVLGIALAAFDGFIGYGVVTSLFDASPIALIALLALALVVVGVFYVAFTSYGRLAISLSLEPTRIRLGYANGGARTLLLNQSTRGVMFDGFRFAGGSKSVAKGSFMELSVGSAGPARLSHEMMDLLVQIAKEHHLRVGEREDSVYSGCSRRKVWIGRKEVL